MIFQDTIKLAAQEKGATDITELITGIIHDAKITIGTCQLFVHDSQSSLLISDTADESTKSHTADFLAQLAPSSDDTSSAIDKSMDAIPGEMSAAITQCSVAFPVKNGRPLLGIWQGIYLWERMSRPKHRKLTITIMGE